MTNGLHSRAQTSRRLRLSAVVCVLLLLFASTAQVAHNHTGDALLAKNSQQKTPAQQQKGAESLCPLCIAMHSALPVVPHVVVAPAEMAHASRVTPTASRYVSLWRFELFGRPPPAAALS